MHNSFAWSNCFYGGEKIKIKLLFSLNSTWTISLEPERWTTENDISFNLPKSCSSSFSKPDFLWLNVVKQRKYWHLHDTSRHCNKYCFVFAFDKQYFRLINLPIVGKLFLQCFDNIEKCSFFKIFENLILSSKQK